MDEQDICFFCSEVICRASELVDDEDWVDGDGYTTCSVRAYMPHTPTDPNED
jgi:hypothetical protein